MRKTFLGLAFCAAAFSMNAFAQNTFPASGNVGIGTTSPGVPLTVRGNSESPYDFDVINATATTNNFLVFDNGNASVAGNIAVGTEGQDFGAEFLPNSVGGSIFWIDDYNNTLRFSNGNTPGLDPLVLTNAGNVGIGTIAPGAKLEVDGNVKLTSGSGASITFQDGSVQSTAYTGVTCGGDYAESVDVTGNRTKYEPGDVLVLDTENPGRVLKSVEAYSTAVSGIYSTKPGVVGRRQTSDPKTTKTEVPMAMVGVVPTKVSAENGSIRVGDLLVSSSTAGYAMKGTDRSKMLGAVIGKAMGNLNEGEGVIEVLVTLQ